MTSRRRRSTRRASSIATPRESLTSFDVPASTSSTNETSTSASPSLPTTDYGLIVPVIHGADKKSLVELTLAASDLAQRARTKKLKPDEVTRGTFTITNPGVYGSLFGTPVINQPQVAILCVGTIEKRPVVVETPEGGDALGIRTMCYPALTYDHRIIDGADAEVFMGEVLTTLRTDDWSELATLDD